MNVLAIIPDFIPSTIIGVLRPLADLERRGEIKFRLQLCRISLFISQDIDWCDIAVFCRNCEVNDLTILYELKRKGKKIVYEIDDNFEEISLTTNVGVYHRYFPRLHVLKRFFSLSDVTRVYSERLLERAVAHSAHPQLIRSYFDQSIIEGLQRRPSDSVIRIVYPTGRIDDDELERNIFSAMKIILQKYNGEVEFHLWRKSVPKQLAKIKGVILNENIRNYEKFIRSFFKAGFDIGLAPGVDTPFFHSKTNNKYREFGGCHIAGVYSNILPYSNSVTHNQTGLLVGKSVDDWVTAIDQLIININLRQRIVDNAAEDIEINYQFNSCVQSWRDCLFHLKGQNSEIPKWLPSPDQYPLFACVSLSSRYDLNKRFKYLKSACSCIPKSLLFRLSTERYLNSVFKADFSAIILFFCSDDELETLITILPTANSIIIDFSTYEGNIDRIIKELRGLSPNMPISFLFTYEQCKKSILIYTMQDYILLDENKFSEINHAFSLSGYPAAYIDLIERHIKFGSKQIKSNYIACFIIFLNIITAYYSRWKRRIQNVSMLIRWRLGLRSC